MGIITCFRLTQAGQWRGCLGEGCIPDMPRLCRHYGFRLYGESLSLCLRERESNQRESAPGIRVSLRETSLASALFRGSSRWAIPGPSFLIWHPCQMPLSTAPPLGLLTGPGDRGAGEKCGSGLDRPAFWRRSAIPNLFNPVPTQFAGDGLGAFLQGFAKALARHRAVHHAFRAGQVDRRHHFAEVVVDAAGDRHRIV